MDPDLQADLAPLFADEPPAPPVAAYLTAGRRSLRHRRTAGGLAAAVVVGALGTTWAVTAGAPTADPSLIGTQVPPLPGSTTSHQQADAEAEDALVKGFLLDTVTGEVTAAPGAVLRQVLPLPDLPDGSHAVGVDVVIGGDSESWHLATWGTPIAGGGGGGTSGGRWSGGGTVSDDPEPGTTFAAWVAVQVASLSQPQPDPGTRSSPYDLVSSDQHGDYTLGKGVELVQEITNPYDLPAPFTSAAIVVRKGGALSAHVVLPNGGESRAVPGAGSADTVLRALIASVGEHTLTFSAKGPMASIAKFGTDHMPVLLDGVQELQRVDNPLGVAAPRRSVAYEVRAEGRTWWYLWELGPSGMNGAATTQLAGEDDPSLDAWLMDQRSRTTW